MRDLPISVAVTCQDALVHVPHTRVQTEHESLAKFLTKNLSANERSSVAVLSFNQWPWTTGAVIETAVAAHLIGSVVTVGFWCDKTPLKDTGWSTSHRITRFTRSTSIEASAKALIQQAGVPDSAFVDPPIHRHRPHATVLPDRLTRSAIRSLEYCGSDMGRSILQVHPNNNTPIREDFEWPRRWVRAAVRSYAWVFDQTQALIERRGITTIVVFNGRFTHDRAAAAAAESMGVKVLYYDYGGLETSFDLTHTNTHDWNSLQERMQIMWDSWGDDREAIAREWFENREKHQESGIEAFVGMQEHNHLPDLPEDHELMVFFSSSGDEIAELDLDWTTYFDSQENAVRTLARIFSGMDHTTFVVRTHPHMLTKPADDRMRWIAAVNEIGENVHIPPDSPTDSYALMRAATRIFTYGSTTGVEAAYRGMPVAVLGPSAYHLLGCVTPLESEDAIRQWITDTPTCDPTKALPYGLMMQRRGFNLEWLSKDKEGALVRNGTHLADATPMARKLSDLLKRFQIWWLTR